MILDTLITDRTQADVNRASALNAKGYDNMTAAEKAEWDSNLKGSYNASDLNRVGEACDYVANRLHQYGYAVDVQKIPHQRPIYDPHTLLLLHGDETEDYSVYERSVTNHGVVIEESITKFGGGSLRFNAASWLQLSDAFDMSGDFTVDLWAYFPTQTATEVMFMSGLNATPMMTGYTAAHDYLQLGRADVAYDTAVYSPVTYNTWIHFAVVRKNGVVYLFRNGSLLTSAANTNDYSIVGAAIGSLYGQGCFFNGYIDEFRISDVARWTESFTPPTEAYSNIIGYATEYTWQMQDIPTPSEMNVYLQNVRNLRNVFTIAAPQVPSDAERMTYQEANNIEKILIAVDELLERVIASFVYSGQTHSGIVWEAFNNG